MKYLMKLLVSLLIGVILLYLSVKDVNFVNLQSELTGIDLYLVFYAVIISILIIILKSIRYSLLLNPIKKISQTSLMPLVTIGLLAIIIIPLRLGEFVRPYLVSRKEKISFTSTTTAILIERLFEIAFLLFMIFYLIVNAEITNWLIKPALYILITFFILMLILYFFL